MTSIENMFTFFSEVGPVIKTFRDADQDLAYKCALAQTLDYIDLMKEDLVFSADSLRSIRKALDGDVIYLIDAEIKTYPTKFLIKRIAKIFADMFNIDFAVFSPKFYEARKAIYDFADDLMMYDRIDEKFLSYDKQTIAKTHRICYLKMMSSNIDANDVAGRSSIVIMLPDRSLVKEDALNADVLKKFIAAGDSFGYDYIAYSVSKSRESLSFVLDFEAKWQDDEIEIKDKLYHVAPASSKDKILKRGISPHGDDRRSINKKLNTSRLSHSIADIMHPYRVYLFNGLDMANIMSFLRQAKKKSLSYSRDTKSLAYADDFCLFEIDKDKIKHLKLYRDNNFESKDPHNPTALYTYSNIPPDALKLKDVLRFESGKL